MEPEFIKTFMLCKQTLYEILLFRVYSDNQILFLKCGQNIELCVTESSKLYILEVDII